VLTKDLLKALSGPLPQFKKPDYETMVRTINGEETEWTFDFDPPPVNTMYWNQDAWIRYIGNNWRKR